jgi:large subunit GTPase 1
MRAYCASREHVSHAELPDETMAARQILKDYIDGKIPQFELSPGVADVETECEVIAGSEGPTTSLEANESDAGCLDEEDEDDTADPAEPDMRDVLGDLESFDLANE